MTSRASLGNIGKYCVGLGACLELFIKREYVVLGIGWSINSTFCIFAHSFLKEVGFALEGYSIDPWEAVVGNIEYSRLFHLMKEAVGAARIECIGS
jgi:hypothetical protein